MVYSVERTYREQTVRELRACETAVVRAVTEGIRRGRSVRECREIARRFASTCGFQVSIIGMNGEMVAGDAPSSAHPKGAVSERLQRGCGSVCHGELFDARELAVQSRIDVGGRTVGWIRISAPMSQVRREAGRTRRVVLMAMLFAAALASFLATKLASGVAQPIVRMSSMARKMAEGDFRQQVPVTSRDEIGELAESLNAMAQRLGEMTRAHRAFVANVSHELRTPVASIRALVDALLAGAKDDPGEAEEFLRVLGCESERLANLVQDLLDITTLESPTLRRRLEKVSVEEAVSTVVAAAAHEIETRRLSLSVDVPSGLEVTADKRQLERALANLLDNAVKYTPPKGAVAVEAVRANGAVMLSVKDTGIGIPQDEIPRIFERFYRVDKARSRAMGGTGLGLAIVKEIVDGHGGSVQVESQLGKGSKFTLVFPDPPATG
ncbi:MAG: HAMP domain-containing sensor histidine kinase [Armatimonadota bacterium]